MVIEFDRNEKRIVLSHTRIWEQAKTEEKEAAKKEERAMQKKQEKLLRLFRARLKNQHWAILEH